MTYTLGFTTEYYTLWEVSEPYKKYTFGITINGQFTGEFYLVQDCYYRQNLSKDYEAAVAKIADISAGVFKIDLALRGSHHFVRYIDGSKGNDIPKNCFSFGQLMGQEIMTATDVWQLKRAVKEEKDKRRKVYARKRLIDLGELVQTVLEYGDKWVSPKQRVYQIEKIEKEKISGHHYENGKRITVNVKETNRFCFDTQYGTMFICEYITEDGKLLKYKGNSPIQLDDDFTVVAGTVEHIEYKGVLETRLKRIKKLNKVK